MIRRIVHPSSRPESERASGSPARGVPEDFYRQKLKEALGNGVEALNDPEIERKVESYFRENPTFSRDAVHVAAVACQFKKEQVLTSRRQETAPRQETFSHSPGF